MLHLSSKGNFIPSFVGCPQIFVCPQTGYWAWSFLTPFVRMRLVLGLVSSNTVWTQGSIGPHNDKSLITYQKISKKIVIPSLSSMCFSSPISSEWLFSVNLVSALCMFLSAAVVFVRILCTAFFSIDFNKFLFKTGSHSTIHIFKNYFATVFLVFSF